MYLLNSYFQIRKIHLFQSAPYSQSELILKAKYILNQERYIKKKLM